MSRRLLLLAGAGLLTGCQFPDLDIPDQDPELNPDNYPNAQKLPLTWVPQDGTGPESMVNCGPACVVMVLLALRRKVRLWSEQDRGAAAVRELRRVLRRGPGEGFSVDDVVMLLGGNGAQTTLLTGVDEWITQVGPNQVAIVRGDARQNRWPHHLSDSPGPISHFMVLGAVDDRGLTVLDPLALEGSGVQRISTDDLRRFAGADALAILAF